MSNVVPIDALQRLAVLPLPPDPALRNGNGAHGQDDDNAGPVAITICMADVTPVKIRWIWPGRIAAGKLTLLVGKPGQGKSYTTMDLAARFSTGTPLPGTSERSPILNTLLLALEDDVADTIRPRLDRMGADVRRVHYLQGIREGNGKGERLPRLDLDLALLEERIERLQIGLVIVDPINAYMGDQEGNNDIKMRSILTPLSVLAARTECAVVAVTHDNKSKDGDPLHRVMGSLAYVAVARSVLALGVDPENPARRVIVQVKNNLAAAAPGLGFSIIEERLVWDNEPVTVTAETVFGGDTGASRESAVQQDAQELLLRILRDGPVRAKDVLEEARDNGIAPTTLARARQALGIATPRSGFGPGSYVTWTLPNRTDTHRSEEGI